MISNEITVKVLAMKLRYRRPPQIFNVTADQGNISYDKSTSLTA